MDSINAQLLQALIADPRATVLSLAETVGISRNTVQARLTRFEKASALASFEQRIEPSALGYPLTAFITIVVTQRRLGEVSSSLASITEVLEVFGLSGPRDLLTRIAARDASDLYRIAGQILAIEGVERTETALVMRRLVSYRTAPLLARLIQS